MSVFGRTFEPEGDTQNTGNMTGVAITVTINRPSDKNTVVNLVNIGTSTVYVRVDGTTPTTSNAKPVLAGTDQTISMPAGSTTVKAIGAAGSTLYVTPGRGA